jgi:hypothetical protein
MNIKKIKLKKEKKIKKKNEDDENGYENIYGEE